MRTDLVGYRVEDRDEVTHVLEGEDWVEHFALASVVFAWGVRRTSCECFPFAAEFWSYLRMRAGFARRPVRFGYLFLSVS